MKYTEIPITEIEGFSIGQAENVQAATGLTVIAGKNGMKAGLDVRGGGPASRDSQMLNPLMTMQEIHAVVLSGGSAFGLGAADVMSEAILRAVQNAESAYGYPAASDL